MLYFCWFVLVMTLLTIGQLLTGCLLAFYYRAGDLKRAVQALQFMITNPLGASPEELRMVLGICDDELPPPLEHPATETAVQPSSH
ncbi:MAG: hypothetical protein SFX18_01560 [Pirellulales bacterium]|nr:hypothetical protein [Pirellulales bacterium]